MLEHVSRLASTNKVRKGMLMNMQFGTTDEGFELRLRIAWKPFLTFVRNLVICLSLLTLLLSTPAGTKLLALLQIILAQLT